ncbi:MAG: hypothetical protein Q8O43_10530 [Dehalococcoidia bacterium]|nr:hypothetical protein [Dehalococcoidia bacterium]
MLRFRPRKNPTAPSAGVEIKNTISEVRAFTFNGSLSNSGNAAPAKPNGILSRTEPSSLSHFFQQKVAGDDAQRIANQHTSHGACQRSEAEKLIPEYQPGDDTGDAPGNHPEGRTPQDHCKESQRSRHRRRSCFGFILFSHCCFPDCLEKQAPGITVPGG